MPFMCALRNILFDKQDNVGAVFRCPSIFVETNDATASWGQRSHRRRRLLPAAVRFLRWAYLHLARAGLTITLLYEL